MADKLVTTEEEMSEDELHILEAMKLFQKSPFAFMEETLGETPQPIKPEYKDTVLKLYTIPANEFTRYAATIKKEMFQPFVKGKHLTWQQCVFIIAVQRAVNGTLPRKIAVKAGRGTGKSNAMSKLILWFLFSFPLSKIPCTAPTADQLFAVLWSELNLVLSMMKPEYAAMYEWETKFLRIKQRSQVWYARAKTAGKGETGALSGIHADYMASFADESYDIEDEVFQVAEATQTGDISLMVLVGNAVHDHGYFFDCFGKNADEWIGITMNGEESPIVNRAVIEAQERQYGKDSNHYRASVLGEFPVVASIDLQGYSRLFTDDWLDEVMPTNSESLEPGLFDDRQIQLTRSYLGIDPSGEGADEASGYLRNDSVAKLAYAQQTSSNSQAAAVTIEAIEHYGLDGNDVVVDNFGIGADLSREVTLKSSGKYLIDGKNVGDKCEDALDQANYLNERARIYDALYWWGKRGGKIRYDERLREELKTIFKKKTEQGKMQIMPKPEARKRGYVSQNRCFVSGTKIRTTKGLVAIENVSIGDFVYTPLGHRKVTALHPNMSEEVVKLNFSDGSSLTGTGHHKIYTKDKGIVSIDALTIGDTIKVWKNRKNPRFQNLLSIMAGNFGFRVTETIIKDISTKKNTGQKKILEEGKVNSFIDTYTKKSRAIKYLKDILSIISITTLLTILLIIWSVYQLVNTLICILKTLLRDMEVRKKWMNISQEFVPSQKNGIHQKLVGNSTPSKQRSPGKLGVLKQKIASFAKRNFKLFSRKESQPDSVLVVAPSGKQIKRSDITPFQKLVLIVIKNLWQTEGDQLPVAVTSVQIEKGTVKTYDISVETDGVYYANDILVGNSDALALTFVNDRMMSNYIPRGNFRALNMPQKTQVNQNAPSDPHSFVPDF